MAQKDEAVEGSESTKPAKGRLLMIAAVVLALLVGGGGVAAYFIFIGDEAAATAEAAQAGAAPKTKALYTKIRTQEGKPMFVVTLSASGGSRRMLQVHVETKSREQDVVDALTLHMPRIVGLLNTLLSTQQFEQLQTQDGKLQLRSEALGLLQDFMQEKIGRPGVEALLFTSFVMQ